MPNTSIICTLQLNYLSTDGLGSEMKLLWVNYPLVLKTGYTFILGLLDVVHSVIQLGKKVWVLVEVLVETRSLG